MDQVSRALLAAGGGAAAPTYVNDAFSTHLYTGNGSTQTITNGIDLSLPGGMVWIKNRNGTANHALFDLWPANNPGFAGGQGRGLGKSLATNSTAAEDTSGNGVVVFFGDGFQMNSLASINTNGQQYASWAFRRQPRFFDVVTYTGNGAGRTISHNLGAPAGLLMIKRTNALGGWVTQHIATNTNVYFLNSTAAGTNGNAYFSGTPMSSSNFTVGAFQDEVNAVGGTYVAYLFAHDTAADGMVQCGSFTTDGSGNASVTTLGWEPQFLMVKASSTTGDWIMLDSMRGWNMTAADARLLTNSTAAETTAAETGNPTATGFRFQGGSASATYIYMAIRRPNKPPTTGASVFGLNADTAVSHPVSAANSRPEMVDTVIYAPRDFSSLPAGNGSMGVFSIVDRLRGLIAGSTGAGPVFTSPTMWTGSTASETTTNGNIVQRNSDNTVLLVKNTSGIPTVSYALRRAPGFFDVVCYTGTGTSGANQPHTLGVRPELIIYKMRNASSEWYLSYAPAQSTTGWIRLRIGTSEANTSWTALGFSYLSTSSAIWTENFASIGTARADATHVAYLFATLPGISMIGTYTGNGTSQTINCGFTTGARFVLIKRTDAAGDWYVWDTARGIVAANEPSLSLNSGTSVEINEYFHDSIDPANSGFIVNQVAATNVNVTSATYLYLAIA